MTAIDIDEPTARATIVTAADPRGMTANLAHKHGGVSTVHLTFGWDTPRFNLHLSLEQRWREISQKLCLYGARHVLDNSEKIDA